MAANGKRWWACFLFLYFISTTNIDAKLSSKSLQSLSKIKTVMKAVGKKADSPVDKLKNYLESDDGQANLEKVESSLNKVADSVSSVTSSDAKEIVVGAIDIIAAGVSLIPVVGSVVSALLSVISTIIGGIGGSSTDIGTIVKTQIEKALNNYDDSQLRGAAYSTMLLFSNSQAYLNNKGDKIQIQKHEIAALAANVPVYTGVQMLGMLTSKVHDNAKSSDKVQVKRAIEYTKLYVTLAVLRHALLLKLYSVVRNSGHSDWTAASIYRTLIQQGELDEKFIKIVVDRQFSRAMFYSIFYPSEWPTISKFAREKGFKFEQFKYLDNGPHTIAHDLKYTMGMGSDHDGTIQGMPANSAGEQGLFYLDVISAEDNTFYIRSKKWPTWYVVMNDDDAGTCRGLPFKPGNNGEWKLVKYPNGSVLMTPKKWPNWFLYFERVDIMDMTILLIRGQHNYPGKKGEWKLDLYPGLSYKL